MGLRLSHTTFDARDSYAVAEFWRRLTDWEIQDPEYYRPGSKSCALVTPDGYTVLFYYSPDAKTVKNRGHFDLVPTDGRTPAEEISRALSLGATMLQDARDTLGWAVLADPEGNEFCILVE